MPYGWDEFQNAIAAVFEVKVYLGVDLGQVHFFHQSQCS